MSQSKRLLAAVPAKIAAGVVGALLAGSLGAGAMTGTITLTANDNDRTTDVTEVPADDEAADEVVEDEVVGGNDDLDAAEKGVDGEAAEGADADTGTDEPKGGGDPTTAPIPTSVSEAAKNHQFDEACGNHGAYVSHYARTGEEPTCATDARKPGTGTGTTPAPAAEATEVQAADSTGSGAAADAPKDHPAQSKASPTGVEKSEAGKARAAQNKAKAPGKANAGR